MSILTNYEETNLNSLLKNAILNFFLAKIVLNIRLRILWPITDDWLSQQVLLSEDLDRDGVVDFTDFAILADNWL